MSVGRTFATTNRKAPSPLTPLPLTPLPLPPSPPTQVRYLPDRWFPPLPQQLYNYLTIGCLVDNDAFERCTKRYYGDTTFEEAFRRTGCAHGL